MKISSFFSPPTCVLLPQAHLVAAFEQSLGNMTIRLKSLTLTAEQKVRSARLADGEQSAHSAAV